MFLSLKDLNTLRNHQTTQKSKFEFICLQRVCKGCHQSHGWERWIKARTRWRTVETDIITGKGTFSDILTNFSSSFSNNRRISIRSLFFASCTWKKYYLGKLRVFFQRQQWSTQRHEFDLLMCILVQLMNDSDSSLLICKSCYEKRGIIYPQLIDTEIDQSGNGTYTCTSPVSLAFFQCLTYPIIALREH